MKWTNKIKKKVLFGLYLIMKLIFLLSILSLLLILIIRILSFQNSKLIIKQNQINYLITYLYIKWKSIIYSIYSSFEIINIILSNLYDNDISIYQQINLIVSVIFGTFFFILPIIKVIISICFDIIKLTWEIIINLI